MVDTALRDAMRIATGRRLIGRLKKTLAFLASAAVLALGWTVLGPTSVGGQASYVVTDGISMLPHFRADGLVITRVRDSYALGDVVAYHNAQLHAVVMHRIVGRDGDRFIMKGDNNDFYDSYHPTGGDIVGQEWVYVPRVGQYFRWLRKPVTFGVLIGLLTLIAVRVPRHSRRRRRHHAR